MKIPDANDLRWKSLINCEKRYDLSSLGLKMLLSRLIINYNLNPSPEAFFKCIESLQEFMMKNGHHPKVQADIELIFEREAKE